MDDSHANHVDSIFMTLAHKLKASKPMMNPMTTEETPPAIMLHRIDITDVEHSATEESSCYC